MHTNAELLTKFYEAFQQKDHAAMAACYHPDVVFNDSVFKDLRGWRAGAMWHMLCERGKDLTLEFSAIHADDLKGSAHWEARYTFSATGHKVLNKIDAAFEFADGLIVKHDDTFDMYKWASQALGIKGKLLGWLPPVQNAVRKQASKGLEIFIQKRGLDPGEETR